jgi:hypothetical protein
MFKAKWIGTAAAIFLFLLSAIVLPAKQAGSKSEAKALVGSWKMTSTTPDGDSISWTLRVNDSNGKLTAFITGVDGTEQPVKDLDTAEGKIRFKVPYQGEDYDINLTMDGDHLVGTWSGNGDSGKTSGVRST